MDGKADKSGFYFYLGVFAVTFVTLALQIVQTRILSVVTWYYLAFFAISMAMFGLTAGAVWVYYHRGVYAAGPLPAHLARNTAYFAMVICVSFAAQNTLALVEASGLSSMLVWLELAIILAAPYFFSGVVVSLALTQSPYPVGKVYGVDLFGAAAGCIGAFALLNSVTAYAAMFALGAVAAMGAVCFAKSAGAGESPAGEGEGYFPRLAGRRWAIFTAAALAAAVNAAAPPGGGLEPIMIKDRIFSAGNNLLLSQWNSFSNVLLRLGKKDDPALFWGQAPKAPAANWRALQAMMWIDHDAGTCMYNFTGDKESVSFLRYDITTLAYNMPRPRSRAAVIGVGGGRDILSAHYFGFGSITGVDVNPIFIKLLTGGGLMRNFAGLADLPGVRLINDEARSWFRSSGEKFDFIQMSLVDTWAATGAGAFTLSENSLYTLEAWELFLNRLDDDGVFTVSRWFKAQRMDETGRVVSLAAAALFKTGATNPARHIALAEQGKLATIIISKRPFDATDVDVMNKTAEEMGYRWIVPPGGEGAGGVAGRILASGNLAELVDLTSSLPLDLTPPIDDRPFFFNILPLGNPLLALRAITGARFSPNQNEGVFSGNVRAATALLNIFAISLLLTMATILIPLHPAVKDSGKALAHGATIYFAAIGAGFILVELAMLQRFSVFLGHPVYSLTVSLFALILSTGVGALLSERIRLQTVRAVSLWAGATAGCLALFGAFGGGALVWFDASPITVKIAASAFMISSVGILLGFGFPTGMRIVSARDSRPTPWLWGVNGACGVLGSSVAIWISLCFGISAVFIAGAVCYLAIIPASRMMLSAR